MTGQRPPVLPYLGATASRDLQVERTESGLTITWPAPAPWTVWVAVGSQLSAALSKAAIPVMVAIVLYRFFATLRPSTGHWHQAIRTMLPWMLATEGVAIGWLLLAAHTFRRHRRWGRVPRSLTVASGQIVLSWPGQWRMRRREWPTARVTSLRWKPVSDVFRGKTLVTGVTVRFSDRRPLRFRLATRDAAVMERARSALHELVPLAPADD